MTAVQSALALVGTAVQAAKGSPAAQPTFSHGVRSGSVVQVEVSQDLEDLTSSKRISPHVNRTAVQPGQEFTTRVFPRSIGAYLYGVLGAVATTGGPTFAHVFSPADDLPYLSLFGRHAADLYRVADAKVDELTLTWSNAEPIEVSVTCVGCALSYPATYEPSVDEQLARYLHAASGTFELDVDGDTPLTAKVAGGEIRIANNLEAILLSGSVTPDDVFPARHEFSTSLQLIPTNLDDWRTIIAGAPDGAGVTPDPVYGSFKHEFVLDDDTKLSVESPRMAAMIAFPDANPLGGPTELALEGVMVQHATDPAIKVTLTNLVDTYTPGS